jgi:hypothetical protein
MRPDQRFETRVAELLRWRTDDKRSRKTIASGALPFQKGDILHQVYHVEAKHTQHPPIRVLWAWWDTVANQADTIGRVPCLALGVGPAQTIGQDIAFIVPGAGDGEEDWGNASSHRLIDLTRERTFRWRGECLQLMLFPKETPDA